MLRFFRNILVFAVIVAGIGGLLYFFFLRGDFPEKPVFAGDMIENSLQHQDYWRTYSVYRPTQISDNPAIIFALHPSRSTGLQFQKQTSYEFERIADESGFLIVYPDGFEGHWNGCRAAAMYDANVLGIDDVGFLSAIVDRLVTKYGADREKVFAAGLSNGGHMAFRLALETPEMVRGIAAIAASLPKEENMACTPEGKAVSVLIMNGTSDPVNPYDGGEVSIYGLAGRGLVRSTDETAEYFRSLEAAEANHQESGEVPDDSGSAVQRTLFRHGETSVMQVRIRDGGHTIPHPTSTFPRFLGPTSRAFNGPEMVAAFFESLTADPLPIENGGSHSHAE